MKNPILFMEFSEKYVKNRSYARLSGRVRSSGNASLSRGVIVQLLEEGFSFYKNFEYNKGLHVVEKFVMRENSLAKSLRYSFLETAKISMIGSLSPYSILFSVDDETELKRICSVMMFSRSKSLDASLTHIKDIGGFFPNEKLELSRKFVRDAVSDKRIGKRLLFRCFPFEDAADKVADFLLKIGASDVRNINFAQGTVFIEAFLRDYKPKLTKIVNHSYITEISDPDEIMLTEHYLRHDDYRIDCVTEKSEGIKYPAVGIIDSGVAEDSYLKKWESGREIFVSPDELDPAHGTFVAGRVLADGDSFGGTEFLDVTVMPGKKGTPPDLNRLADILHKVVPKYKEQIKIWNLSLGTNTVIGENISLFAHLLDSIQRENDVLFILPAGNFNSFGKSTCLEQDGQNIVTVPAESLFSLTVGSISHIDTNLTPFHAPSLFSRRGRGVFGSVKPELVHYGGTHEKQFQRYVRRGVFSIGKFNEVAEDTGTSHSAPVVAGIAARLFSLLGKDATVDAVKALLIHKASDTGGGMYTGWGLPENEKEVVRTDENTITIIHTGIYQNGGYIETDPLPVPEEMINDGKFSGEIRVTLAYRPPVSISYCGYYTCMNMKASVGYYKKGKWEGLVTDRHLRFMPDEKDKQFEFLWLPLKDYSATINSIKAPDKLYLRISVSKRDFWKENCTMSYAAVVSFRSQKIFNYNNYEKIIKEGNGNLRFLEI